MRYTFCAFQHKNQGFLHDHPIYLMPLKVQNVHSFQARVPICQFLAENVVRHGRIRHFLAQKMLRSAVGTPICQIVPVSRAYHLPPPVPGGVAPKFGSEKVLRYAGVSQLQLRMSRYTVQLSLEDSKSLL